MPERVPVALRLAPGLAKALLRLCLPPEVLAQLGPALELVDWSFDAVAGVVRARLESDDAERVLAALSAPELEGLLAAVEREGGVLDPAARARVLGALATALEAAGALSPAVLVEADLAPGRVASAIAAVPVALDGPERLAWERLCVESARALVRSASSRPGFAEAATGEVLARLRRVEASLAHDRSSEFDDAYRAALRRRLDRLRWHGVDHELGLAHAVPLAASAPLGRAPRTLLLGEAGAGKSTRLAREVVALCDDPAAPVPFLVPLRAHADGRFPAARDLVAATVPHLADEAPRGWVQRAFRRGAWLVLDGLDELPRAARRPLLDWVGELCRDTGGDVRVVIASRPGATTRPGGDLYAGLRDFAVATVEPLDAASGRLLLERWWRQAGGGDGFLALEAAFAAPGFAELAGNPLLVTLLAAAHRERNGAGGGSSATVLAAARALLRRPDAAALGDTVDERLVLLSSVALWMVNNGLVLADPAELDEALVGLGHPGADLRQSLLESSGCLRASPGGVAFTHGLLRDTLAGWRAAHTGNLGLLVDRAHDEAWRGVVAAALALAPGPTRDRLVSRLRAMAERRPERRGRVEGLLAGG